MDIVVWVLSGIAAVAFVGAGAFKLTKPRAELQEQEAMAWTEDFADHHVKLIGALEVLGAVGLVLPRLLDVAPVLSPVAGIGLFLLMAGAVVVHVRRQEPFVPAAVLGVIALLAGVLGFTTL